MNKKSVVLFSLFLVILFVFASCGKTYGKTIVDQEGMEHIVMTDANGETVIDHQGNLIEIVTDSSNKKPIAVPTENGTRSPEQENEYETQPLTFPGILEESDKVEDQYCSLTLPDGWTQVGSGRIILRHTATNAQISIYPNVSIVGAPENAVSEEESEMDELDVGVGHESVTKDIDGYEAVGTHGDFGTVLKDTYLLITEKDIAFRITCTVNPDNAKDVDFDSVLSTIHFK